MKELAAISGNIHASAIDGKFHSMIEVVIITTEPEYANDGNGGFAKMRSPQTFRFTSDIGGLDQIIKSLTEMKEEARRQQLLLDDVEFMTKDEANGEKGHQ